MRGKNESGSDQRKLKKKYEGLYKERERERLGDRQKDIVICSNRVSEGKRDRERE
jgi:hypothetical protein